MNKDEKPDGMVETLDGLRHYALVNVEPSRYGPEGPKKIVKPEPEGPCFIVGIYPEFLPVCKETLLPAFMTEKAMAHHNELNHAVTLLKWKCRHCLRLHCWCVCSPSDTNGNWTAGADLPPEYILEEYHHPDNERLFRFFYS